MGGCLRKFRYSWYANVFDDVIITGDFLSQNFDQNEFFRLLEGKRNILVVGMGGGCDVFMAYTIANEVLNSKSDTGSVMYANCISERKQGVPDDHITLIPNALYTVPPGEPRPLQKGENTYGTTLLEQSVPRGPQGSPFLIEIKGHKQVQSSEDVEKLTLENTCRIEKVLDHLKIDLLFGVDCGGDSLTGGKDFQYDIVTGRDQQVISAVRKYQKTHSNLDFIHIVLGPGCDGETKEQDMVREIWRENENPEMPWCSGRKYIGAFHLKNIIEACFPFVQSLEQNRTPFLMYRALVDNEEFHLERPHIIGKPVVSDNEELHLERPSSISPKPLIDRVKISRHGNFELIPREWLIHGLVFTYSDSALI